ncbi:cyclic pyranopterin monophosphate synthase MoaC [Pelobacter seleniigenes]|uniref:cyclic pyranopterin monophosphate synthase MoaC n=1 Tax=Pelobacter seleniigenes TaxID=407188 RepID=UPI0004A705D4|nr:cyclic pyranopterin monophosphate synthase MoaC [Pelobacter seleniigenes]
MNFNHFDERGNAVMVDVSAKNKTLRTATAEAVVVMPPAVLEAIQDGGIAKGDVLGTARLAGIMAAKKTPDLIPLSHPLALHSVSVDFAQELADGVVRVSCTVRAFERTGVEMEAMTGAALAALTIYDMCKGSDKSISLKEVKLIYKEGGKSGVYRREERG